MTTKFLEEILTELRKSTTPVAAERLTVAGAETPKLKAVSYIWPLAPVVFTKAALRVVALLKILKEESATLPPKLPFN